MGLEEKFTVESEVAGFLGSEEPLDRCYESEKLARGCSLRPREGTPRRGI